jgi:hypothetical protein
MQSQSADSGFAAEAFRFLGESIPRAGAFYGPLLRRPIHTILPTLPGSVAEARRVTLLQRL